MSKRMSILRPRPRASKTRRAPVRRAGSQEECAVANEEVSTAIGRSGRTRQRRHDGGARQARRRLHGNGGDEHRQVRTRTGPVVLGGRLRARRCPLEDRAAARLANRGGARCFVLLRLGGTAARRTHLAVEPAQILRPRERDRWQQHHQREDGQKDATHGSVNPMPGRGIPQPTRRSVDQLCTLTLRSERSITCASPISSPKVRTALSRHEAGHGRSARDARCRFSRRL
jgi:hypothetical protein